MLKALCLFAVFGHQIICSTHRSAVDVGSRVSGALSLKFDGDCNRIFCPDVYKPVCGSSGRTYSNGCELGRATCKDETIQLDHKGVCKKGNFNCVTEIACIARYAPVCGSDGQTYSNGCYLAVARCRDPTLSMKHGGRCQKQKLPKQKEFD